MKNKYYYTVLPYSYYRKNRKYTDGGWFMNAQDATMTRNFSKGKGTSSIMGMLGGASDILKTSVDLAQIADTTETENALENMGTDVNASSLDSLMEQWGASANTGNSYTWRDVRGKSDGELAGGILGAGLSGATAGAAAGPIGAIVGGAIGLIGSGIGAAVGRNKAERKAGQLNDMANEANLRQQLAFSSNAESIMDQQNLAAMSTLAAHGGKIYIKPSKRGTFTAAAKRRGLGVQEFASKVLANKDRYSSAMVKKANFARNFGGHRKDDGGYKEQAKNVLKDQMRLLTGNRQPEVSNDLYTEFMQRAAQERAGYTEPTFDSLYPKEVGDSILSPTSGYMTKDRAKMYRTAIKNADSYMELRNKGVLNINTDNAPFFQGFDSKSAENLLGWLDRYNLTDAQKAAVITNVWRENNFKNDTKITPTGVIHGWYQFNDSTSSKGRSTTYTQYKNWLKKTGKKDTPETQTEWFITKYMPGRNTSQYENVWNNPESTVEELSDYLIRYVFSPGDRTNPDYYPEFQKASRAVLEIIEDKKRKPHKKALGGEQDTAAANSTVTTNDIVNALHLTDEFYDLWETMGRDSVLNRQKREAEAMRKYLKDTQGAEIHISDTSFDRMPVLLVKDTETNADLGIGLADSYAGVFRGSENIVQEYGVPPQVIIGSQESPRFVEDGINGNIVELGPVDVVAHERAHATGSTFSTPFSNKLLHKLLLSPYNGYDETPEERGANLMGLRALMYKEGIKEAAEGGEITMEQLKEMKEKYPKLRIFQFNEGNEEDLLKALNLIAQNNTSDTKSGTSHMAAKGGPVSTRNDFSNGVTKVENGGTHEQNPMEGVPMGIAPDGLPNLVEEGEVIFNDYVFSNRLKPKKKDLEKMNLKKYKNRTFAQIAKNLQKESEERPNDPISKNGLEDNMAKLTALQEEVRNNTEKSSAGRIMWPGGPLGEDLPSYWISPKYFEEPHIYGDALPTSSKKAAESQTESSFSPDPNMSFIQSRFFPRFPLQSTLYLQSAGKTSEKKSEDEDSSESSSAPLPTGLRYAPAIGSLIGSIASAFAKPDYEHSNSLLEAASRQRPSRIRFRPVGNYMRYNPLNTSYMMNRLNAETAGTRRALENMSGGNAAAARNQLTTLNRSSQDALGDTFIRASQYNDNLRRQVEEFNRGTNMFNSQGAMQADSANAQMQNAYDARRLAAVEQAMRMREAADAALEQSRALNFTNLFDNLGDIGRENFSFNQTRIPGLRYGYIDKDGNTVWLNSYGGMLTKRTRKRRRR